MEGLLTACTARSRRGANPANPAGPCQRPGAAPLTLSGRKDPGAQIAVAAVADDEHNGGIALFDTDLLRYRTGARR